MAISPLVTTEWLAAHLKDADLRTVDVRWYLFDKDKTGRDEYLRGHIPGAVFLDIDADLAAPRGEGPGRHPLPTAEAFAEAASRAGIGANTHVIAYDDRGGATAARLWWLLRYFGHDKVSLLDGGIAHWKSEGRPIETDVPTIQSAKFAPKPNPDMVVDQATVDILRNDPNSLVLDVRVPERYEGKIEPIDPRAGHIPGARNAPYVQNVRGAEDTRFRDPSYLRQEYEKMGAGRVEKIVCYCGSGVNACQTVFALYLAGFQALLYEGSWSDWSSNPERPAGSGPNP